MTHALIIEDEPLVAMAIEDVLLDGGVTSIEIAVEEAEAISAALARKPDIITSDVALAVGTGPAAVEAILLHYGPIPVIFITATPGTHEEVSVPTPVLQKPFASSTLRLMIQDLRKDG